MDKMIYPFNDNIGFVQLIDEMKNDVPLKVVNSARISYAGESKEFDEKDLKLAKFLLKQGHTSPYRHSYYTFHIKMPIFVARQFMRYNVGCSWSEKSLRYTTADPEFYIPEKMRENLKTGNKQASVEAKLPPSFHEYWRDYLELEYNGNFASYQHMLKDGIAKEIARQVLPVALYTEVYWTASLQTIMHFIDERLKPEAQFEIRQYAKAVYQLVKPDLDKLGVEYE